MNTPFLQLKSKSSMDRNLSTTLGFELPESYQVFVSMYLLGPETMCCEKKYRKDINDYDILGPIAYSKHNPREEVHINYFLNEEELLQNWEDYDRYETTGARNLIQIAYLSSDPNGGLYLGYGEKNNGEIWVVNWDRDKDRFLKVCDTLEEFIADLEQYTQE